MNEGIERTIEPLDVKIAEGRINYRYGKDYLIGRTKELLQLYEWVLNRQSIAITGLPGVGKTALADLFLNNIEGYNYSTLYVRNRSMLKEWVNEQIVKIRADEAPYEYILCMDGVEMIPSNEVQEILDVLINLRKVRSVIFTSQIGFKIIKGIQELYLEPLSKDELYQDNFNFLIKTVVTFGERTNEGKLIEAVTLPWFDIIRQLDRDPNAAYQIPPDKWEEIIAGAYKQSGFDEVILTPRSGDFGRDVIAIKKGLGTVRVIDQVKAQKPSNLVTANDVRALLGVLQLEPASKGFLTTTSDFAPGIKTDPFIAPLIPQKLGLINGTELLTRLNDLSKKRI